MPACVPYAEVRRQVRRSDDRLGLEEHRRTGHPGHGAQRLGQVVHLRLVLARGAHPLPDEGDGVEAEHLDPEVGQRDDDVGVLAQDRRVRPVDVPLVVVERRPDPAAELVVPGEVAGREVGEDLGQAGLVGVGHLAVGVHVEVVALLRVARPRGRAAHSCSRATWLRTRSRHRLMPCSRSAVVSARRSSIGAEVAADRAVVHDRVAAVVGRRVAASAAASGGGSRRRGRAGTTPAGPRRRASRRTGRRTRRTRSSRAAGTSRGRADGARRAPGGPGAGHRGLPWRCRRAGPPPRRPGPRRRPLRGCGRGPGATVQPGPRRSRAQYVEPPAG